MDWREKLTHAYSRLQQRYNVIYSFDDVVNGVLENINNKNYLELKYYQKSNRIVGLTTYHELLLKFVYQFDTAYLVTFLPITKKDKKDMSSLIKGEKQIRKELKKNRKTKIVLKCKKCGYENKNNAKTCWRCGYNLTFKGNRKILRK